MRSANPFNRTKMREAAKGRAGNKGSGLLKVGGGAVGATLAGIASQGNPAAIAAGYQLGSSATDALTGDDAKPEDVQGMIQGGIAGLEARDSMKEAALKAAKDKKMQELFKRFLSTQGK